MDTRIGAWSVLRASAICIYNVNRKARRALRPDSPIAAFAIVLLVVGVATIASTAGALYGLLLAR